MHSHFLLPQVLSIAHTSTSTSTLTFYKSKKNKCNHYQPSPKLTKSDFQIKYQQTGKYTRQNPKKRTTDGKL